MKLSQLFVGADANQTNPPDKVSSFRRLLPQFLASIAQNLLSGNMGLALAFPTIVVPAVLGLSNVINPNESLHMTADGASWLASISFIVQPFGCFLSGIVCECLGRKRSIVAINIVPAIAWLLLANANTPAKTYVAVGLLGFGIGLTNSITYVTEVWLVSPFIFLFWANVSFFWIHYFVCDLNRFSEASIRGILMACSGIITTVAMFSVFLLGSFLPWRHVAFISAIVPILNIIVAIFLPETPIWLLSKKHDDKAIKSLQWLRGWVSSDAVTAELNQLKKVSELSTTESPGIMDKLTDMTHMRTLKPFILVSVLFVFMQFSGMFATRPYIVPILSAYGISLDANLTTVILGVIGVLANVALLFSIRALGKRNIYLYSMLGNLLACIGLSVYGCAFFPANWSSIETSSAENKNEIIKGIVGDWNYFALVMFLLMQFFLSVGVSSIPYFLMYEIFPFKSRSFYCSVVGALNQLVGFIATKTYYDSEKFLSLSGVFAFYGILAAIGYALMYFMLPETEHRSLEDIEFHYSDDKKGLFDIDIRINAAANKPDSNETKNVAKY